jgi:hypothetical protein
MKKSSEIILVAAIILVGFVLPHLIDRDSSINSTRVASQAVAAVSAP